MKFLKRVNILQGKNKILLLMDLHKSHLFNYDFMKMMRDNNVEVCGFPPHCTHLVQPLDITPFARFKTEWQKELMVLNWYLCGHRMSRQQFFRFFIPAYQAGLTPDAIRKGFQNCGIFPCDRTVPKLKKIGPSTVFDRCKLILRSWGGHVS